MFISVCSRLSLDYCCLLFFRDMKKNVQVFLKLGNQLAIWHYHNLQYIFHVAFFVVVSEKKLATNLLDLATTLENLGARCLLEKKVNFVPC